MWTTDAVNILSYFIFRRSIMLANFAGKQKLKTSPKVLFYLSIFCFLFFFCVFFRMLMHNRFPNKFFCATKSEEHCTCVHAYLYETGSFFRNFLFVPTRRFRIIFGCDTDFRIAI